MNLDNHVAEDKLEAYALGKLSDDLSAPVEEHLLVCSLCQTRLEEADEFIRVMKAAVSTPPRDINEDGRLLRKFGPLRRPPVHPREAHFAPLFSILI